MLFNATRELSLVAVSVSGSLWNNHCFALLTLQGQLFHFPEKPHGIKILLANFCKQFPVNCAVSSGDFKKANQRKEQFQPLSEISS